MKEEEEMRKKNTPAKKQRIDMANKNFLIFFFPSVSKGLVLTLTRSLPFSIFFTR